MQPLVAVQAAVRQSVCPTVQPLLQIWCQLMLKQHIARCTVGAWNLCSTCGCLIELHMLLLGVTLHAWPCPSSAQEWTRHLQYRRCAYSCAATPWTARPLTYVSNCHGLRQAVWKEVLPAQYTFGCSCKYLHVLMPEALLRHVSHFHVQHVATLIALVKQQ